MNICIIEIGGHASEFLEDRPLYLCGPHRVRSLLNLDVVVVKRLRTFAIWELIALQLYPSQLTVGSAGPTPDQITAINLIRHKSDIRSGRMGPATLG